VKLMIRRGQLRPVKLGRLTRIPRSQLAAMFVPVERFYSCNQSPKVLPVQVEPGLDAGSTQISGSRRTLSFRVSPSPFVDLSVQEFEVRLDRLE
jgi:hypothetical protein